MHGQWVGNILCHTGHDLSFALLGTEPWGTGILPRQEGVKDPFPLSNSRKKRWNPQLVIRGTHFVHPFESQNQPASQKSGSGQGPQPRVRPCWERGPWLRLCFLSQVPKGFSSRTWFPGPLPTAKILLLYIGRLQRQQGLGCPGWWLYLQLTVLPIGHL